jgi:hypothetical protein
MASRADTSRRLGSRAPCPLRGFGEVMTVCEPSFGPFKPQPTCSEPITAGYTSPHGPSRCSAFFRPHASSRRSNYTSWREPRRNRHGWSLDLLHHNFTVPVEISSATKTRQIERYSPWHRNRTRLGSCGTIAPMAILSSQARACFIFARDKARVTKEPWWTCLPRAVLLR